MRDVSFGQYYPSKSVVHKMDARIKIVFSLAYIVLLILIPTLDNFLNHARLGDYIVRVGACYLAVILFLMTVTLISKVPPIKVLRSVKAVVFLVIFTAVILVLFYGGKSNHVYFHKGIINISLEGIINAVSMAIRLFLLVMGPSLLTLTTTPVELTDGMESLLKPLKFIKVPVHEIALIMSIALRLIPNLIEETDKIRSAQKARCADFDSGNLLKRAKAMIPILIPLLISSFRRADELAYAMDSRCYRGAKGRTRMKIMRPGIRDLIGFLVFAALFFVVLMFIYDFFGVGMALADIAYSVIK